MKAWQLQEAKAKLSEVIKEAALHGPQEITLHGKPAVVVLSKKEYDQLIRPKLSLVEFIRQSPLIRAKINLKRDSSLTRKIDDL